VSFALARAGKVRLDVFSVTGQKVATLVNGELAAGQHSAEWNGRNLNGESAPSGIYYVHLVAPGARLTLRLARIR
jgi:flagellar hook assembly protein FlgD